MSFKSKELKWLFENVKTSKNKSKRQSKLN